MVLTAFPAAVRYTHDVIDSDGRYFCRAKDDLLVNGEIADPDLWAESLNQKYPLGSMVEDLALGQRWRYCKNGAAGALLPGTVLQMPVPAADHSGLALSLPAAVGDTILTLVNGGTTPIAVGDYRGGLLVVITGALGLGDVYRIKDTAVAATGATFVATLYDRIRRPLAVGTHTVALNANPYRNLIAHVATPTARVVAASMVAIPAGDYFWGLVKGEGPALTSGTVVIGDLVAALGATGAVAAVAAFTNDIVGKVARVGAAGAMSTVIYSLE
jgi:hypothetical protein